MFGYHGSLSNRDLFGGRRARRRQREQHTDYESPRRVLRWSPRRGCWSCPIRGLGISDPGAPADQDQRLVAVPATPSPYPTVTPSRSAARHGPARIPGLSASDLEKPAVCHRELKKKRATATRSNGRPRARNAETAAKRRAATARRPITQSRPRAEAGFHQEADPGHKVGGAKGSSSASGYATRSDWAKAVLAELNAERANHGLPALKLNSKLVSAASTMTLAMAKANKLSHQLSGEAALGSQASRLPDTAGAPSARTSPTTAAAPKVAFSLCRRRCTTRSHPTTATAATS